MYTISSPPFVLHDFVYTISTLYRPHLIRRNHIVNSMLYSLQLVELLHGMYAPPTCGGPETLVVHRAVCHKEKERTFETCTYVDSSRQVVFQDGTHTAQTVHENTSQTRKKSWDSCPIKTLWETANIGYPGQVTVPSRKLKERIQFQLKLVPIYFGVAMLEINKEEEDGTFEDTWTSQYFSPPDSPQPSTWFRVSSGLEFRGLSGVRAVGTCRCGDSRSRFHVRWSRSPGMSGSLPSEYGTHKTVKLDSGLASQAKVLDFSSLLLRSEAGF